MNSPAWCLVWLLLLTGCAGPSREQVLLPDMDIVLLGEQHDASSHPERHRQALQSLVCRDRLAALAIEMAEAGTSTAGLPPTSDEAAVRAALRWNGKAWPWENYAGAIMAAVRAGVPVLGANLPAGEMREAMRQTALDGLLPDPALKAQQQAIREGHCGLLPEEQIAPMTRIQIARDQSMARTIAAAVAKGRTVVLLAGAGHVDQDLGVPQHLPRGLHWQALRWPGEPPRKDHCAELREQLARPRNAPGGAPSSAAPSGEARSGPAAPLPR